jgi:type VI secretion system protein ImpC
MNDRGSIRRIDVELTTSELSRAAPGPDPRLGSHPRPDPNMPFRILCLGDFSGQSSGDVVAVDRDDLDGALARARPELRVEAPEEVTFGMASLEDFHPDRLFDRLDVFGGFRALRRKLHDPDGFRVAAAEVRRWMASGAPAEAADADTLSEGQAAVRDLLAGGGPRAREAAAGDEWTAFLRHIVAPHLVAREDPQRPALVAAVDRASAVLMRSILHHPRFQALEAAWRAVDFLTRRLETSTDLQVSLFDISKADLAAALDGRDAARARTVRRLLIDEATTPGAMPWAILAGNYTFDARAEDVSLLTAMARLAREAGAPFVAAASPRLLGADALEVTPDPDDWRGPEAADAERWQTLRSSPDAAWLGLALPRFLLRLPYGRDGERIDTFDFDELSADAPHAEYLWGNAAFACACLLGRSFSEDGWGMELRAAELDDLPLYVEDKDGERRVKPCAETLLTLRAAERILDAGLMPLLSFRDRDVVRLPRFQSVRSPLTALAGRWG